MIAIVSQEESGWQAVKEHLDLNFMHRPAVRIQLVEFILDKKAGGVGFIGRLYET